MVDLWRSSSPPSSCSSLPAFSANATPPASSSGSASLCENTLPSGMRVSPSSRTVGRLSSPHPVPAVGCRDRLLPLFFALGPCAAASLRIAYVHVTPYVRVCACAGVRMSYFVGMRLYVCVCVSECAVRFVIFVFFLHHSFVSLEWMTMGVGGRISEPRESPRRRRRENVGR